MFDKNLNTNWDVYTIGERAAFCMAHNIPVNTEEWYELSIELQLELKAAGINSPRIGIHFCHFTEIPPQ
jgi:hypothetical protein